MELPFRAPPLDSIKHQVGEAAVADHLGVEEEHRPKAVGVEEEEQTQHSAESSR